MDIAYIPGAKQLLDTFINGTKTSRPMIEVFYDWLEGKDILWGEKLKLWPYISAWTVVKKIVGIDSDGVKDIINRKKELMNAARNVIESVLMYGLSNPIRLKSPLIVYFDVSSFRMKDISLAETVISNMWDDGVCMLDFVCKEIKEEVAELIKYARSLGFAVNITVDAMKVDAKRLLSTLECGIRNVTLALKKDNLDRELLRSLSGAIGKRLHVKFYLSDSALRDIEESLSWLFDDVKVASIELFSEEKEAFSDEEVTALFEIYRKFSDRGNYIIADSVLPVGLLERLNDINTRFVRLKGSLGKKIWEYVGYTGEGRVWGYVDRKMRLFPSFESTLSLVDLRRGRISDVWYNYSVSRDVVAKDAEIVLPTNTGSRFTFEGKEESPSSAGQGAG